MYNVSASHHQDSQAHYGTKMKDNYGLLIASLVAIVAIVGLVILFSGAATGALVAPGQVQCPSGYTLQHFVGGHGSMASYVCAKPAPDLYGWAG